MPKGIPIDLTGQRFGGWTVLGRSDGKQYKSQVQVYWLCRCDCGNENTVSTGNLRQGKSTRCRSCGNSRVYNARWALPEEEM